MDATTSPVLVSTVVATFASKSNPSKVHSVHMGKDGVCWCSCPSWRFQKNHPSNRTCKHVDAYKARVGMFNNHPVAVRAPRCSKKVSAPVSAPVESYRPTSWERL
jgi:hypothetical protein